KLVYDYRVGSGSRYEEAGAILDKLSRTDNYQEAEDTIRFTDRELNRLAQYDAKWKSSGLYNELGRFLTSKKRFAAKDGGRRLYANAKTYYGYLKDLSDQTALIQATRLEYKIGELRK